MPIGKRAISVAAMSVRHVRDAQDLRVALHGDRVPSVVGSAAARSRARTRTSSSIAGVSLPVNVFCWLGWKQPSRRPCSAPCPKRGRGRGTATVEQRRRAQRRLPRERAEADHHARRADQRQLALEPRRAALALLRQRLVGRRRAAHRGGDPAVAQLEPVVAVLRRRLVREAARCSAANRKSPERSPVNTRPVRLAPCAAGASPRTSTRAAGSPKPGIGRPQYSQSRNEARFSRATRSRHSTRRGQARQAVTSASSASSAVLTPRSRAAGSPRRCRGSAARAPARGRGCPRDPWCAAASR